MKHALLIGIAAFTFSACSSLKSSAPAVPQPCMTDAEVKKHFDNILPSVDKMSAMEKPANKNQTTVIEKNCYKHVFERNGYRIIFYKNPTDPKGQIAGSLHQPRTIELDAKTCLMRATIDLRDMRADFADRILEAHKKKYGWLWDDPELGPVKWLDCAKERSPAYYVSLATMIHELNHDLSAASCVFSSSTQERVCMFFPRELPMPVTARFSEYGIHNKEHIKKLNDVQELYLVKLNHNINNVLEEMNSYTLTTKIESLVVAHSGPLALISVNDQQRNANLLPLFQVLVARYFVALKKERPKLYDRAMGRIFLRNNVAMVLKNAEDAQAEWVTAMEKHNMKPYDFEKNLMEQYARLKPDIFPTLK